MEIGYLKGELCCRHGCNGVIEEHEVEGSCSCHSNPPCSYCTTAKEYCPECNWEASEEDNEPYIVNSAIEDWGKKYQDHINGIEDMRKGIVPIEKFECYHKPHTHFSMIKTGCFPPNSMSREAVESKVSGSWGGRFTEFNADKGTFSYIAYTD